MKHNISSSGCGVSRFAGHSPGPDQAAVHFTRKDFTWAGSNPVPLWCPEEGFPASRIIPLGPVRQRCTSPGRILPELDRTQYRFGVQKRQGSFRMGGNRTRMVVATTGPSCHLDYFVRTIETLFSILVY
ncbi:hypothetical protein F2Q70_00000752 [Brassica cretica]|uniref:Uncharacterized protein n=1 Tax=Brassica cretica TaxID=69181 RepID=A0A8S9IL97_BRACR|nr:hypothetical protein F2Q70_00000752 [Brassica cretica]